MNTIKIYLDESGSVADLRKDFPLYQYQFQNILLNIFVPTSLLAPNFTVQSEGKQTLSEYVAGTAVKIGMSYLTRSGDIKVAQSHYMRFLKTLTYQGVEYALFERKLPKEFTYYAGQDGNSPVLVVNVLNIDTESTPAKVLSILTSQRCNLEVLPSSNLDNDEPIEASELDIINARLNEIDEILPEKQDKEDLSINMTSDGDNPTWQDSQTVVGAINNNTAQTQLNKENISQNTSDIATAQGDIAYLYAHLSQPEEYIGQMTGTVLPTDAQLNTFVEQTVEREPKNADVIFFILTSLTETDKNYKYIYSVDGWNYYEIPAMQPAENGVLGLVDGTYNVGSANDTIVSIIGGEIKAIYVKDSSNTLRNIREYLNTNSTNVSNIINGTTSVGVALKAIADSLGNDIVQTYLTQSAGATKQYVRDYALPRDFNDVFYISSTGYSKNIPEGASPQFSVTTSTVGDYTLFSISKTTDASFELSRKNSCNNSIYVASDRDCIVQFRLTTEAQQVGFGWQTLGVELSNPVSLTSNTITRIDILSVFSSLNEQVLKLSPTDLLRQTFEVVTQESTTTVFDVYSNAIYPSIFTLNTTSMVIYHTVGKLGEEPVFELSPSGDITASGISLIGSATAQLYNNVECKVKITIPSSTVGYNDYFINNLDLPITSITLGGLNVRFATPYNFLSGQPTFKDLQQVNHYSDINGTIYELKCFIQIDNNNITFVVDEDNLKHLLVTEERHTIATTDWTALSDSEPFTYSATITATHTIGTNTEVGIINDQPVLFANYGFVVGAISGQSVTIYATELPTASVTLVITFMG